MSFLDQANTFYSEPEQEAISQPILRESGALDIATQIPATASNPVYSRYNDAGQDTFAPLPQPSDPSFQPATEPPQPVQSGFQFQPWMILAAGAALVLYLRSDQE